MARCKGKTKRGRRCKSPSLMPGSEYCYRHNPEIPQSEKKAASSKGGKARRVRLDVPIGIDVKIETVQDVLKLLEAVIGKMLNGEIDVKVASTTGYLSNVCLRALMDGELEKRVERLEEALRREKPN